MNRLWDWWLRRPGRPRRILAAIPDPMPEPQLGPDELAVRARLLDLLNETPRRRP